jgi:hypothetical protein
LPAFARRSGSCRQAPWGKRRRSSEGKHRGVHRRLVATAAAALVLPAGLASPRRNPFPLTLPAGAEAEVTIVDGASDEGDLSDPLIGPETVTVPDVEAVSLVAHVGGDGVTLVLNAFVDPLDPTCTGNGALVFRNTSGGPLTDVHLDGEVVLTMVGSGGGEDSAQVPAGTYDAELFFSGDGALLLGPFDLEITAGVVTVVYAVGASVEPELLVVEYEVGETDKGDCAPEPEPTPTTAKPVPTGVPAGQGTSAGTGAVIAGVAFLGLLGTAVLVAARARRQGA